MYILCFRNKKLDWKPNICIYNVYVLCLFYRNVAFFAGSVLAVLVVLTVIDEDVLAVEHVLTTMTVAGMCMGKY